MATSDNPEATDQLFGLGALMSELKRLETRAMSEGFLIAATLIGAAAEAVADEMVDRLGPSTEQAGSSDTGKGQDKQWASEDHRMQ